MSEGNGDGIIVVGKKGLRKFRYDDKTPPVEIDVLLVSNKWYEIEQLFTVDNTIPVENYERRFNAAVDFVKEILQIPEQENVSYTSAMHFIKLLNDEAEGLKSFFEPKSGAGRSSPENSAVGATFSA